ncbi:MAG: hypothetical protein KDC66_18220 [Phaeodactylibacter sp.]|nr:hypothetical protein [Phaeodactylibacter sp.]MCB9276984.1 hypothetical protein [Lewinellaceae bacterium]
MLRFLQLLFLSVLLFSGCYSFRGISIDYETVKTYYVEQFTNNALNAQPALAQRLAEDLKEKIRTESRLVLNDENPDIEFKGTIVRYDVSSEAPQPGETTALNRLTITTAIEYINNKNEDKGWKKNFSFFYDFSSSQDLSSVEDDAVSTISNQMMEDIFNAAFTDW